jgi:hypothetical protein
VWSVAIIDELTSEWVAYQRFKEEEYKIVEFRIIESWPISECREDETVMILSSRTLDTEGNAEEELIMEREGSRWSQLWMTISTSKTQ